MLKVTATCCEIGNDHLNTLFVGLKRNRLSEETASIARYKVAFMHYTLKHGNTCGGQSDNIFILNRGFKTKEHEMKSSETAFIDSKTFLIPRYHSF